MVVFTGSSISFIRTSKKIKGNNRSYINTKQTEPGKARQSKARQGKARQGKAKQSSSGITLLETNRHLKSLYENVHTTSSMFRAKHITPGQDMHTSY